MPPDAASVDHRVTVLRVRDRVPYREALAWQRATARRRIDGQLEEDLLVLLEHEPVVTLGRGAREGRHLRAGPDALRRHGVDRVEVERGGDVTYHGPGQLVGYPLLDLAGHRKDLHWYLRRLEETLIRALGALGVTAFRVPEHTGVWVGEPGSAAGNEEDGAGVGARVASGRVRKIASIGVHVSRWVTWHGFALNVTDRALQNFGLIVPCGIDGVHMTCLASEGVDASWSAACDAVVEGFEAAFSVATEDGDPRPWRELGYGARGGSGGGSPADRRRDAPEGRPPAAASAR